jgi:hypothetical protein
MFGADESTEPLSPPPAPPWIARVYGIILIALALWGIGSMARTVFRRPSDGFGWYMVPTVAISMTPFLVVAYLGAKVLKGERLAVYALVAISVICLGVVMALDVAGGITVMMIGLVVFAPLLWTAGRESGGFH